MSGAKWVPGQIAFQSTRTGRLPSLQPLVRAGLPLAPYVEHGSYVTWQPDIMRYGRDPYRGIMGLGQPSEGAAEEVLDTARDAAEDAARRGLERLRTPAVVVGVGAAAGLVGGLLGKSTLGTLLGAGGGLVAYTLWLRKK